MQLQVLLKPTAADVIEQYMGSLEGLGLDLRKHDLKLEEDNWENPSLGAWGVGWQVMLDGQEITQFTYFQQVGGIDLDLVPAEITYGLERLTQFLQGVESVFDIEWTEGVKYSRVWLGYWIIWRPDCGISACLFRSWDQYAGGVRNFGVSGGGWSLISGLGCWG